MALVLAGGTVVTCPEPPAVTPGDVVVHFAESKAADVVAREGDLPTPVTAQGRF